MSEPFSIRNSENSAISFCNLECYGLYLYYIEDHTGVDKAIKIKQSKITCFFCIGCGERIFAGIKCMVHGEDGCPEVLWYTSLPNVTEFMETWNTMTRCRKLTGENWDFIDKLAKEFPILSGNDLAEIAVSHLYK